MRAHDKINVLNKSDGVIILKDCIKNLFILLYFVSSCASALTLTSQSMGANTMMPREYTCEGPNISPDLAWVNPPAKTESYSLIFSDLDAPKGIFYHWLLYNLPKTTTQLEKNLKTTAASIGKNSYDKTQYNGPCPPKGETHRYLFTLYALDAPINLPEGAAPDSLLAAMHNHVLSEATLAVRFKH